MVVELDAGDAMTDRERLARVILDQISHFFVLLDTDGRVLEVNRAALNWSGLDRQKVLGRTFLEVDWWGAGQNAAAWLKTAMGRAVDGEPVHGNLELVQTRGSGKIEFSLTPVPDEFGRIEYVVMECRDITLTEHDIDELKRAQDALRGQARWLETVLESVSDGLIATGADGHIRLINSAAQTLTGWKMREAVGRPLEEVFRIVDESTRGPLECPGVTVLREGRVVELANHAVLLARDGTERPITDGGAPIRDEDGSILGGVLCFHDASLRRQAELAVARLAAIVESSDDAIIGQDLDGHIISWNDGAHRIYGYTAEEVIGRSVTLLIPTDRLDEFAMLKAPLWRGERVKNLETIRLRKDGSTVDVSIVVSPIRDGHGRLVGVSKIARDISERKRVEADLRAREEQLRLALEAAHMSAWDHDLLTDQIILSVSDKYLFGDAPGTYDYKELNKRIHPEDREAYVRARRERAPISREARFVLPDGSIRWVWTQGRFIRNETGEAVRAIGTTMDITERKRAEEALNHYATRLTSLHEIDRAILAIQPPEKIARVALRHLAKLVPFWRASVARIDLGTNERRVLTSIGALSRRWPPGTLTPIEPEDLDALKRGQSTIVDDLHQLTGLSEQLTLLKNAGARSAARLPLLVRGRLIGSINLYSDRPGAYTADTVELIREAANQVAIALHNTRLYEENRLARQRLEVLSRRLIRAQEDERRQIARELHDEIGQALTAVKVNLQGVKNRLAGQDDRVTECIAIVDDTLARARSMALDLRPSLLDDLGLVAALQWYVERHARRTGLEGRFIADPEKLRGPRNRDCLLPRGARGTYKHRPACAGDPLQRRAVATQRRPGINRQG